MSKSQIFIIKKIPKAQKIINLTFECQIRQQPMANSHQVGAYFKNALFLGHYLT